MTNLTNAIDPFRRAYKIQAPLNPSASSGIVEYFPRIWPTMGEMWTLITACELTQDELARLKAERDELREALERLCGVAEWSDPAEGSLLRCETIKARAVLAKGKHD